MIRRPSGSDLPVQLIPCSQSLAVPPIVNFAFGFLEKVAEATSNASSGCVAAVSVASASVSPSSGVLLEKRFLKKFNWAYANAWVLKGLHQIIHKRLHTNMKRRSTQGACMDKRNNVSKQVEQSSDYGCVLALVLVVLFIIL